MKLLITGGTGFIGSELLKKISHRDMQATVLVRKDELIKEELYNLKGIEFVAYGYGLGDEIPLDLLANSDGIINMAGEPIFALRWTRKKKKSILASRISITRQIAQGLEKLNDGKKRVFISASAVGYYGDKGTDKLRDSDHPGDDFLAKLCQRWEAEALKAEKFNTRVVLLRTGIVLGKNGGALNKMIIPYSFGIGGSLGDGAQYISWIHLDDIVEAYLFALENKEIRRGVNATAPNPVNMKEFSRNLGKVLNKPAKIKTPAFALNLLMGEVAKTVTTGQRAIPFKLLDKGFKFKYSFVYQALENTLKKS